MQAIPNSTETKPPQESGPQPVCFQATKFFWQVKPGAQVLHIGLHGQQFVQVVIPDQVYEDSESGLAPHPTFYNPDWVDPDGEDPEV